MITRRGFIQNSVACASSVLPSSFSQIAKAKEKAGGTITVAIFADPLTFDPTLALSLQGRAAARAIHDTLFTLDRQGRLAPGLATSWQQSDEKTFIVQLRSGISFQDGTSFDAAAVKFNIDRLRDPALGSIRAGEISTLDTVEIVDTHTIRMKLKAPFAAFLFPFTDVCGCIGSPTAMQKWGKDYGLHPVGTGPFRLVEYQKDSRSVLEKNPTYWDGPKPYLDRIILRPIPTDSTRLGELRAGGVQIAEALPLQNIVQLRQSKDVTVAETPGFRFEYFGFNCGDQFAGRSVKFRQAFQWAINREALHQVAYFGTGSIGYDLILPGSPFFDPNYKPFKFDMDKAKRLIDESGVSIPTTIRAPLIYDPAKQRAAQLFQESASKLGITISIEQVDHAAYATELRTNKMPIDLQGFWGYRPDPDQYLTSLCHSTGSYAKFANYRSQSMDALIKEEQLAHSEEERRLSFRRISDLINEDSVYIPWHYSSDFKGFNPKVKGFIPRQDGIIAFQELWLES